MGKLILEYDTYEDRDEITAATKGMSFYVTLHELDQFLREKMKYGHKYETADDALEDVRDKMYEILNDNGLTLDMIS